MKTIDSLKPDNRVTVTVLSPEGTAVYQSTETGYHSIGEALREAVAKADLSLNPEDYVFEVANRTTDVTHRYRINAHGNLKLIV